MPREEPAMSGADFTAWMELMGFTWREAQQRLGIGNRNTVAKYRLEGAPLSIALACSALAAGLGPWSPGRQR